jgi:uncharacterized membrane protein YphA (DoxX/SURF4 family)
LLAFLAFGLLVKQGFETYVYSREREGDDKSKLVAAMGAHYISASDTPIGRLAGHVGRIDVVYEATGAPQLSFEVVAKVGAEETAALLTRIFVGGFFVNTGWGKMHHLDQFGKNFAGWGIPYPHFNAALSAYTEIYGGLLTIAGLAMRFVAVPMIINMLVALFSVVLRFNVSRVGDFFNADEPLYVLTYLMRTEGASASAAE